MYIYYIRIFIYIYRYIAMLNVINSVSLFLEKSPKNVRTSGFQKLIRRLFSVSSTFLFLFRWFYFHYPLDLFLLFFNYLCLLHWIFLYYRSLYLSFFLFLETFAKMILERNYSRNFSFPSTLVINNRDEFTKRHYDVCL